MTQLQSYRFLLQVEFLYGTDLVIKICYIMTMTTNAKNLRQCKIDFL